MSGAKHSSRPPENIEELDNRIKQTDLRREPEIESGVRNSLQFHHEDDLLLRPLAKTRIDARGIMMAAPDELIAGVMRTPVICAGRNDNEPEKDMSVFPLKKITGPHDSDNSGEDRQLESGERPAGSMEIRQAEDSRERLTETLSANAVPEHSETVKVIDHIEDQLKKAYNRGSRRYITSPEDLEKKILFMSELSILYREDTLAAHEEIVRRLLETRCAAEKVYDKIHRGKGLRLSNFEKVQPNEFVRRIVKEDHIKPESLIFELGPGGGEDARYIASNVHEARVIGVDISHTAVEAARRISKKRGLDDRVNVTQGNFIPILNGCQGQPIDGIYTHSTSHYLPGKVQEHQAFPAMARVLKEERGKLFLAMKIARSDSAQSLYQIELAPGHPDNPKIDLRSNGVFRDYPENEERVHQLLGRSGLRIIDSRTVPIVGYDRPGKTEYFCQLIAEVK